MFSRNTFCAHVCPVGPLLGLYARLAPVGWGVKDKSVCEKCRDKSCISNETAYAFQGRSCGVGLYPAKLEENTECLLCGQCLKACDRNNPGLGVRPNPGWFRRPWFKDILQLKPLTNAQAAFCLIVSGFVVYELFTEWPATKSILLWLPTSIERVSGAGGIWRHGLITSLTLFFGLPTLFWLLPLAAFLLAGGQLRARDYTLRFGIAFIPIMAAAHAIKALLKMTSRIPYWRHAASDPIGTETARSLLANATQLSSLPAWCEPAITVLSLALMAAGVTASLAVVQKLIAEHLPYSRWRNTLLHLIPVLYGGTFTVMLVAWRLF